MFKTIMLGKFASVQGNYLRTLPDGQVEIRVDDRVYTGKPVSDGISEHMALPQIRKALANDVIPAA